MDTGSWQLASLSAADVWRRLSADLDAAAASARHPLHLVTVVTVGADGSPESRTVVLRGFDAERRELWFHTDIRSPKAGQIARDRRVALHWYDARARIQIRIAALAEVHHADSIARDAWLVSQPMSRACYGSAAAPGTPLPEFPAAPEPLEATDSAGLANFAVIRCGFAAVELLALHVSGHERILLRLDGDSPTSTILAP
jgi:pyridoxamine 5'-phosphate oxidase